MTSYVTLPTYTVSIPRRYQLIGNKCKKCGAIIFPPRFVCPECGSNELEDYQLRGKGKIYTYTVVARPGGPGEFDEQQTLDGDYGVAVVQLEEGPLVVTQLTDMDPDPQKIEIGMEVESVLKRLYEQEGVVRYCYKFRPVSKQ